MAPLACGGCADSAVLGALPFVFYWWIAPHPGGDRFVLPPYAPLILWGLAIGVPLGIAAMVARARLPLHPARFFLGSFIVILGIGILLGGSLMLPLVLVGPVWIVRLAQHRRPPAPPAEGGEAAPVPRVVRVAARVNRMFLAIAVLLVPVAYLRLHLQMEHPEVLSDPIGLVRGLF